MGGGGQRQIYVFYGDRLQQFAVPIIDKQVTRDVQREGTATGSINDTFSDVFFFPSETSFMGIYYYPENILDGTVCFSNRRLLE